MTTAETADETETNAGASYLPAADWTAAIIDEDRRVAAEIARNMRRGELPGWRFEQDARGDWRGIHEDGRHTGLKFGLKGAKDAAARGDIICRAWPECEHAQQTLDRQNAPGTPTKPQEREKRAPSVIVSPSGSEQLGFDW